MRKAQSEKRKSKIFAAVEEVEALKKE